MRHTHDANEMEVCSTNAQSRQIPAATTYHRSNSSGEAAIEVLTEQLATSVFEFITSTARLGPYSIKTR